MAAKHDGFKDFVLDQLTELRGLSCRAMFGGYGLYSRSTFFAIIHHGRLYFKTTPASVSFYKMHGMRPFRPNAKQILKSYYEVPVDVMEDAENLTRWARQSANQEAAP